MKAGFRQVPIPTYQSNLPIQSTNPTYLPTYQSNPPINLPIFFQIV